MKIVVINGPNLNFLGERDPERYGSLTLKVIEDKLRAEFPDHFFDFFQSNIEGELVNKIQDCQIDADGLIINPGGYAHTSVAIGDALSLLKIPKVEVHLSHLVNRESFRQTLITASSCDGYLSGFKHFSYIAAAYLLIKISGSK
ncbi:MAG TPA: type II 3-dehydroquinate dehydratase [Ignavibacteriaceae bacterium]|nr:type II 3-dehydroquinate dehydratase [Ignavibacteriaceae bacterium]